MSGRPLRVETVVTKEVVINRIEGNPQTILSLSYAMSTGFIT